MLCRIALALLLMPSLLIAEDTPAEEAYRITLWSTIDVDILGQPARIEIGDADAYGPQLITRLQQRLAMIEFEPPIIDGQPRAFSTPVAVTLEIQPTEDGGGLVSLVEAKPGVRLARQVRPYFPQSAVERWQGGTVVLRCRIGDDGRCREISTEERSGPMALVRAATDALKRAEFEVPRIEGQAVDASVLVPYSFDLIPETGELPPEIASRQLEYQASEWLRMRRLVQGRL